MLSVARTGVSNIFREYFSRIASQISRTEKSRSPNHKPVGIAMNGKQTPKVNLQDWRRKLSCIVYWLRFYTLCKSFFSGASTYWPATKCHPSCTEYHAVGISKAALPLDMPSVSTLERIANNFSQASSSPPILPLVKSWQILLFLLFV